MHAVALQPARFLHSHGGCSQEHTVGVSSDDLAALCQAEAPQVPTPRASHLPQPSLGVASLQVREPPPRAPSLPYPPPSSATGSPREAASWPSSSLDQYNSMLPDNPIQQLPLLPATHTSTAVRVAAWLLDSAPATPAEAAGGTMARALLPAGDNNRAGQLHGLSGTPCEGSVIADHAGSCGGAASVCASLDGCSDLGALDELEAAVAGGVPQHTLARGRCVEGCTPPKRGEAMNNYVSALY